MNMITQKLKKKPTEKKLIEYIKTIIEEWIILFKDCGISHVASFQTNELNDFPGTLVLKGEKL